MAPERISDRDAPFQVGRSSKVSDVYSLAMTSFSVCTLLDTILRLETIISLRLGPRRGIAL